MKKDTFLRASILVASAIAPLGFAGIASATTTPYDPTVDLGNAISGTGTNASGAITSALPWAMGLFGAFLGWRIIKRLVKP